MTPYLIGFAFGISVTILLAVITLVLPSGNIPKSATFDQWYKIQVCRRTNPDTSWIDCLYNGKQSHFDSLTEAAIALADNKQYPGLATEYRIVKVTEQAVSSAGELL